MYIAVQNELVAAYNYLRDREAQRLFGWKYTEMKKALDEGSMKGREDEINEKMKQVQDLIPLKLSEAEPKKSGS